MDLKTAFTQSFYLVLNCTKKITHIELVINQDDNRPVRPICLLAERSVQAREFALGIYNGKKRHVDVVISYKSHIERRGLYHHLPPTEKWVSSWTPCVNLLFLSFLLDKSKRSHY